MFSMFKLVEIRFHNYFEAVSAQNIGQSFHNAAHCNPVQSCLGSQMVMFFPVVSL